MFTAGGSHARLSCRQGTSLWSDMFCKLVPFFMPWKHGYGSMQSTYGVLNMNHKREREYVENIRIKEYNEICSEKFRMKINLWRMREFPFKKIWIFFHE